MTLEINYLAILVCGIVSMILGSVWYGPLFGKAWMKMSGFTKESMTPEMKKKVTKSYVIMFIGSLVMAFVLAHALEFASYTLKIYGVSAGLMGGFWNWLGFVAPVTIGTVLWENKPWRLWFINAGYYLAQLLITGVILSLWK